MTSFWVVWQEMTSCVSKLPGYGEGSAVEAVHGSGSSESRDWSHLPCPAGWQCLYDELGRNAPGDVVPHWWDPWWQRRTAVWSSAFEELGRMWTILCELGQKWVMREGSRSVQSCCVTGRATWGKLWKGLGNFSISLVLLRWLLAVQGKDRNLGASLVPLGTKLVWRWQGGPDDQLQSKVQPRALVTAQGQRGLLYFVFVLGCSMVPSWAPLCTLWLCLESWWHFAGGTEWSFCCVFLSLVPHISMGMLNTPCSHGWMCCCHRKLKLLHSWYSRAF